VRRSPSNPASERKTEQDEKTLTGEKLKAGPPQITARVPFSSLGAIDAKPTFDAIAHHVQPLGLNGIDDGALNGSWEFKPFHQNGHTFLNGQVNDLPYGTEIRIKPN
jgi:hypothetical protein